MKYIMGVDGGGSKTYSVITDIAGNRLGHGISGGSNYQKVGIENAVKNIRESMDSAMQLAGLHYENISFVQYALAGADRHNDFIQLRSGLKMIPVPDWDLVCDTMAGLRTGSAENVGVVLICGSGTNAVGRNKHGKTLQTGGFGFVYGDAAGGNHMALQTFRAAVRSWERREIPSLLPKKVIEFFGFCSMEELLSSFLDKEVMRIPGELTLVLHEAVEEGDVLALRLLEETGYELGVSATSVITRLGGFGIGAIPIVLIGGVFQRGRNQVLLDALVKTVRSKYANTNFFIPEMEPVFGAVLLAMDRLGISETPEIIAKFNTYRRELVHEG